MYKSESLPSSLFLVIALIAINFTRSARYDHLVQVYDSIKEAANETLKPDQVCELCDEERDELCKEAIPALARFNITLTPKQDWELGEKKMYKLAVRVNLSEETPNEITLPGFQCPTLPPIYLGHSIIYGYVHTMIERKYCNHPIDDVLGNANQTTEKPLSGLLKGFTKMKAFSNPFRN